MRRAAVDQPERDAGVGRVEKRALAFDEEHLPAPLDALDDQPLGGARDEVGDDRVDGDPPACDRHPRLARRHELAADAAARASRSSSSETVIFPIAQSEPTVRIVVAGMREVLARRHVQARRRLAQVTQLDVVLTCQRDQLVIVRDELVQAALDVEPGADRVLQQVAPRRREATALRRDADERRRRLERAARRPPSDDRQAVVGLTRPRRVEDRDHVLRPVADHAAPVLPKCGSPERPSARIRSLRGRSQPRARARRREAGRRR